MAAQSEVEEPGNLPVPDLLQISDGISLLSPLSRRGYGPGLILILPDSTPLYEQGGTLCLDGVPPPLLKWAEEGFAVVEIRQQALQDGHEKEALTRAVTALKDCSKCKEEGGIGIIGSLRPPSASRSFLTDFS